MYGRKYVDINNMRKLCREFADGLTKENKEAACILDETVMNFCLRIGV